MDYRELTILLIKVAGAVIIAFAISTIPLTYWEFYRARNPNDSIFFFTLTTVFPLAFPLIIGAAMMALPGTIANRLIKNGDDNSDKTISLKGLEVVAFRLLGLYLLFRVVSDYVYNFFYLYRDRNVTTLQNPEVLTTYVNLAATTVELMFAMYLLFGAKGLLNLLNKARYAGNK